MENVLKNIERLGDKYCNDNLDYNIDQLHDNWWEALEFFFIHSFMRGRRDELSLEYYYFTIQVLRNRYHVTKEELDDSYMKMENDKKLFDKNIILQFKKDYKLGKGNSISNDDFKKNIAEKNEIIKLLITPAEVMIELNDESYTKEIHLGNDQDVMMVLDVLNFICSDYQKKNIYVYLKNNLLKYNTNKVCKDLKKRRGIGDKIANFIIRDIALLNPEIISDSFNFSNAFPIDTWVFRISKKLGCDSQNLNEVKEYFIRLCGEYNVNELKIAAGLWYLGFNSLNILLDYYYKDIIIDN